MKRFAVAVCFALSVAGCSFITGKPTGTDQQKAAENAVVASADLLCAPIRDSLKPSEVTAVVSALQEVQAVATDLPAFLKLLNSTAPYVAEIAGAIKLASDGLPGGNPTVEIQVLSSKFIGECTAVLATKGGKVCCQCKATSGFAVPGCRDGGVCVDSATCKAFPGKTCNAAGPVTSGGLAPGTCQ